MRTRLHRLLSEVSNSCRGSRHTLASQLNAGRCLLDTSSRGLTRQFNIDSGFFLFCDRRIQDGLGLFHLSLIVSRINLGQQIACFDRLVALDIELNDVSSDLRANLNYVSLHERIVC